MKLQKTLVKKDHNEYILDFSYQYKVYFIHQLIKHIKDAKITVGALIILTKSPI